MGIVETGSSNTGAIWAVRQGQQNRRGRGRNNNNRKNHNPLARSFESNGPDVKIRGTPAHIAEKYLTLARDAQTSGDPVLAENYFQHAEHYTRIIMAYREQLQQSGELPNGNGQRLREPGDLGDEFGDDDGEDMLDDGFTPQHQPPPPPQHQAPRHSGGGYEANRHERPFRRDQGGFRSRDNRGGDRDRGGDVIVGRTAIEAIIATAATGIAAIGIGRSRDVLRRTTARRRRSAIPSRWTPPRSRVGKVRRSRATATVAASASRRVGIETAASRVGATGSSNRTSNPNSCVARYAARVAWRATRPPPPPKDDTSRD